MKHIYYVICAFMFLTSQGFAQLTPAFQTAQNAVCPSTCISFQDISTGGAVSWSWSFPGSQTPVSGAQNPTNICYSTPGSYDVSLTVTDATGNAQTLTIPGFINVLPVPQVTFSTQNAGCGSVTGSINTTITGGQGSTDIFWLPGGQTTASISGLQPGTYTIVIRDSGSGGGGATNYFLEDFQSGGIGWTFQQSGPNDPEANFWEVNDTEGGVPPPGCGVAGNGDQTLHITADPTWSLGTGALYNAGGLCPVLFCVSTDTRAVSPAFSTAGSTSAVLSFDYIANGDPGNDYASVWINDGTGWQVLIPALISPLCIGGQGQWTSANIPLPASCNNNPSVQIGFRWQNNDDGVGTDPSVAINNVVVRQQTSTSVTCTLTDSVTIVQIPGPSLSLNVTNATCGQNNGSISPVINGGSGNFYYQWTPGNSSASTLTGLGAGSYTLMLTDSTAGTACTVSASANVVSAGGLTLSASVVAEVCGNGAGAINLNVSGGTPPYTYQWNNGQTGSTLSNLSGGSYSVQVSDGTGCTGDTTITVPSSAGFRVNVTSQGSTCFGRDNGEIKINITGGTPPCTILWDGVPGPAVKVLLPAATYNLNVSDAAGCDTSFSVTLTEPPPINLVATTEYLVPMGDTVQIYTIASGGSGPLTGTWDNDTTLSCSSCDSAIAFPFLDNHYYTYTVKDSTGCTESVTVHVAVYRDGPFIPNAFSPNEDERNDVFKVYAYGVVNFRLDIFNRWGQIIYSDNDIYRGWNGKSDGKDAPQGIYVYRTEIKYLDGKKDIIRGSVTLYR